LPRDEWTRAIRKARTRDGRPLTVRQMAIAGTLLGRVMDLLVRAKATGGS